MTNDVTQEQDICAIFDWDGVIIDSSVQHERSWTLLAEEEALPLPEGHFKQGFGMKNQVIIPNILKWTEDDDEVERLSLRKEELYRELIREHGIEPLPGVRTFLQRLLDAGIACAVGTSTDRLNYDCIAGIMELEHVFSTVVTGNDVKKGKPDPEVFLAAAEGLNRPASRCIVFEDAPVGVEAALAAGMKAVGVATTHGGDILVKAQHVVARLDELQVHHLIQLAEHGHVDDA